MAYCSICDKAFKTVQSLASHRYVYHKDAKGGTQTATKSIQSATKSTHSATESTQSDIGTQMKYESPKRLAKQVNESTQADMECERPKRLPKQVNGSTQADIESDTDMEYERPKILTRQINIHTATSYPRLVKYLCKFIIEGDIPITKKHKKVLVPDADVIRRIAHGRVSEGQNVIREQVLQHDKTGDSALGKLLEIAINILQTMF